jgi:serine protease
MGLRHLGGGHHFDRWQGQILQQLGLTSVDIGAPGSAIMSTVPTDAYASYSGTSMATPHVTGAIALAASVKPLLTAQQLRELVLNSAAPTASLTGKTVTGGRLDIGAMLIQVAPGITTQPTNQTVNEGNSVAFTAAATGNPTPTVEWQVSTDGGSSWTSVAGGNSASLTLTGVTSSWNYSQFRASLRVPRLPP